MGDGPFGFLQYHAGQTGTNKGYTGQYTDPLSGLDYYVARYYDPVVGLFLSADTVQSNLKGFDPYAYVGNNPETLNDPSGQRYTTQAGYNYGAWAGTGSVTTESQAWILPNGNMVINDYLPAPYGIQTQVVTLPQRHIPAYNPLTDPNNSPGAKFAHVTGWDTLHSTLTNPKATTTDKVKAVGAFALKNVNNALQLAMILGGPEDDAGGLVAEDSLDTVLAGGRDAWGMVARSLNPDDKQTLAMLFADGKEYWGINGDKFIPFSVNAISRTHAEIDALAQLYHDRELTGITGGNAVMLVDRPPCPACGINGGIRSAVQATGLDSLVIYYGAGYDKYGNFISSGVMEILP